MGGREDREVGLKRFGYDGEDLQWLTEKYIFRA